MSIDERNTDRFPAAFERVVVELDWYDGPRAGVADGFPSRMRQRPWAPSDSFNH